MFTRLVGGPLDKKTVETDGGRFVKFNIAKGPPIRRWIYVATYEREFNAGEGMATYRFVKPPSA